MNTQPLSPSEAQVLLKPSGIPCSQGCQWMSTPFLLPSFPGFLPCRLLGFALLSEGEEE